MNASRGPTAWWRGPLALVVAALFGAGLYQLHRFEGVVWFAANRTSAAWLLLPFVVGAFQVDRLRAIAFGLAAPVVALISFYAFSPWWGERLYTVPYYQLWFVGAAVTGPVFGALGHLWWSRRSLLAACAVALAFCLEPFAWVAMRGELHGPTLVWQAEALAGIALLLVLGGQAAVRRPAI
ncbi:MAG TPA: DUF6518 family protein [Sporichthya sp.]|nr:DUF6518 family protein [Sporichthya sp.]